MSAFVDSVVEAHDQTPLRHPVRQRFFALFLYIVLLVFVVVFAPLAVVGPRKVGEHIPDSWANVLHYGYYPMLILGLMIGVMLLYRVALPVPLPSHRLIYGAILATAVFVIDDAGPALLPEVDHQHRLHLRRAVHADRVSAVRVLRRLCDHDRRRTQRRHPGRIPGAEDACPSAAQLVGVARAWDAHHRDVGGFAAGAAEYGDGRAAEPDQPFFSVS